MQQERGINRETDDSEFKSQSDEAVERFMGRLGEEDDDGNSMRDSYRSLFRMDGNKTSLTAAMRGVNSPFIQRYGRPVSITKFTPGEGEVIEISKDETEYVDHNLFHSYADESSRCVQIGHYIQDIESSFRDVTIAENHSKRSQLFERFTQLLIPDVLFKSEEPYILVDDIFEQYQRGFDELKSIVDYMERSHTLDYQTTFKELIVDGYAFHCYALARTKVYERLGFTPDLTPLERCWFLSGCKGIFTFNGTVMCYKYSSCTFEPCDRIEDYVDDIKCITKAKRSMELIRDIKENIEEHDEHHLRDWWQFFGAYDVLTCHITLGVFDLERVGVKMKVGPSSGGGFGQLYWKYGYLKCNEEETSFPFGNIYPLFVAIRRIYKLWRRLKRSSGVVISSDCLGIVVGDLSSGEVTSNTHLTVANEKLRRANAIYNAANRGCLSETLAKELRFDLCGFWDFLDVLGSGSSTR